MTTLSQLHAELDARVQAIREAHAGWPCDKGCAACCRRLAELPRLTVVEWELLREGLTALPRQRLYEIGRRIAELGESGSRPLICPLLDEKDDSCPVYAQRPVACRSYGFYAQRERGLYCARIESQVADGLLNDVIWGNHAAIDRQLACLGETRALDEWFALWRHDEGAV